MRDLRVRPPSRLRELRPARRHPRSRVVRHRGFGRGRRTGMVGRRAGGLQPDTGVRPVPTVPPGPALGLRASAGRRTCGTCGAHSPSTSTVSAGNALRIPDSLTTRVAALAEPTAIAIHAVELADVRPEDRVLVTGGGPVGLLIVAVLRARGVTDITVSEPVAARREQALAVGAARTVAPRQPGGPGAGQHRLGGLCGGLRVLGPCQRRPTGSGPAGLRRHPGLRRHRGRAGTGEPQPDDRARAGGGGGLQLQRRGLPARARPARERCPARRSARSSPRTWPSTG